MNRDSVTVCILSWNRPREVGEAVTSVYKYLDQKVVAAVLVLDNGSSPKYDIAQLKAEGQTLRLIRNTSNLGASEGRNLLLSQVSTPYALFMDDDCALTSSGDLDKLIWCFRSNPSLAVITADIWQNKGSKIRLRTPSKWLKKASGSTTLTTCFGFIGGCFLADVSKLNQVNGFPRDGFYGCEELAVSHRLFSKGYEFARSSHLQVKHLPSALGRLSQKTYGSSHLGLRLAVGIVYFRGVARISHIAFAITLFVLRNLGSNPIVLGREVRVQLRRCVRVERGYASNPIRVRDFGKIRLLGWRAWL